MFVITSTKRTSVNTYFIRALEVVKSTNNNPAVGAVIDDGKQLIMAEYDSEQDCQIAIDYVSYMINSKKPVIYMPTKGQITLAKEKNNNEPFSYGLKLPPSVAAEIRKIFEEGTI